MAVLTAPRPAASPTFPVGSFTLSGLAAEVQSLAARDGVERLFGTKAVEFAGIPEYPFLDICGFIDAALAAISAEDHLFFRNAVLFGELPVALVVRRHGHDRTRTVGHEHEVGGEDRHRLARDRVQEIGRASCRERV